MKTTANLFEWNHVLGRAIRSGGWAEQGVATYHLLQSAVTDGDAKRVAELTDYFLVEADVCYRLYRQWSNDLRALLVDWGMSPEALAAREAEIFALLQHPDGRPWDHEQQWQRVHAVAADVVRAARTGGPAAGLVDELVEEWRQCHDRDVDHISGLMNEVVVRHGEAAIGAMYDTILRPWFDARYSEFDVDKHDWKEAMRLNLLVAFEAMRGHLCGPGRRGDVECVETDDRVVLSFDPCGSGGRQVRGDAVEGTPPRDAAPYEWPQTQEPAAWNHFEPGVCNYCAHCVVLTEIMPMRAFGYPVRAVDPPRPVPAGQAPQRCSWTVFKDPAAVPQEYYDRVGLSRPAGIGSAACGGDPGAAVPDSGAAAPPR